MLRNHLVSYEECVEEDITLTGLSLPCTVVCELSYDERDSPSQHSVRRHSSTPAHTKTPPLGHMASPFTDQELKQEERMTTMATQIEKLQVMFVVVIKLNVCVFYFALSLTG